LQQIRTDGDWEGWLKFYFSGVEEVSNQASETAKSLLRMFEEHRLMIEKLGKAAGSALRMHELLKKRVLLSLPAASKELHLSFPAVSKAVSHLERLALVREFTGKRRNRFFSYEPYLRVLNEGTG
ncbi:MAG TPA: Fic family protein, partial [Candidatus Binatia bacterium]|nr:Fic family protein [Candidatus Binatia bacterium]